MRGSRLINSNPSAGCGDIINRDIDGTLSGGAMQTLISVEGRSGFPNFGKNPFGLTTNQCQVLTFPQGSGVAVCPNYDYRALGVTYPTGGSGFENPNWRVDVVRDEDGDRVTPNHFRWISYVIPGKLYRLEVKNRLNSADTTVYPLTTLAHLNIGLSTGDLSNENLVTGGRNTVYDPQWIDRYVTVYAAKPTVSFRVLRCNNGEPCSTGNAPWQQISGTASLSVLQSTRGAGFFVDNVTNRIYFKFNGGDQLKFERL
jgi:hypothetical protein